MAKFRQIRNSFIAGEISPASFGRTDLPQYAHACKTLRNMIPLLSGGAYRRPGTKFEDSLDASANYMPRVIPFVVSKLEAYALLFYKVVGGNGLIEAYRPTANTGPSTNSSVTGTHPYQPATLANITTKGYFDELPEVQHVQSVDVLYLVHPNQKPHRVYRTAIDNFVTASFDTNPNGSVLTGTAFRDAWPYRPQNTTGITITPSATTGIAITLTASSPIFDPKHIGAVIKIVHSGSPTIVGCAQISGFTNSTTVTAAVKVDFSSTAASPLWWESAWSDYRGWPRAIGIFQQRLIYGGNSAERDTLWCSESGDFNQLSKDTETLPFSGPTGTEAFSISINSQQLNEIQWISPDRTLAVGTIGDDYILDAIDLTAGFKCGNVKVSASSHYGSSYHQAQRVDNELFFALASNSELESLSFNLLQDSFEGEPVQLLFDHYPKVDTSGFTSGDRKFRAFEWDSYRKTLWCCDTAGNLFGLTRDKKLGISAWHSHQMGGFDATLTGGSIAGSSPPGTGTTDPAYSVCAGSVLSLGVIPNPILGGNDLWMVVKRKINGAFVWHLERMIGRHIPYDSAYSSSLAFGLYFADCAVYNGNDYPGVEDFTFSGFGHLEGETLVGTVSSSKGIFTARASAVASGDIVLQTPYPPSFAALSYATVFGLPFSSIVETVRLEAGSQIGTAQGGIKRIHEATVRLFKTMACKIGASSDLLETVIFRAGSTHMGDSPDLFTGDKFVKLEGDYDRDGHVYLLQDQPLPFAPVGIIVEGLEADG